MQFRGRRQRSLPRPDDERSIYVCMVSSSIMTILFCLVDSSGRTTAAVYLRTHTLSLTSKGHHIVHEDISNVDDDDDASSMATKQEVGLLSS